MPSPAKSALQNLLVSRWYARRHEQRTGQRRALGSDRTSAARGAAQAQGRSSSGARPGRPGWHHLRPKERHTLGDAPQRDGMRIGLDVLAEAARLAGGRSVGRAASGALGPPRPSRPHRVGAGLLGLGERTRKKGGPKTGPNPTDKGKAGSKRHVVADRGGVPLAVVLTAANVHDRGGLGGGRGCHRADQAASRQARQAAQASQEAARLHKAYDFPRCRKALRKRCIKAPIARRGIDSSERLGRYRWVVERTLAWLGRNRRLTVRYERRDEIHEAFLHLGCSLICLNYLR